MKKFCCSSGIIAGILALSLAVPARAASGLPFTDLEPDAWYTKAVNYVIGNGVMHGIDDTLFAPLNLVTRGMVYQTLYNLEDQPAVDGPASFSDVEGTWYADAAAWAEDTGLTTGTGENLFSGDRYVTRQELAKIFTGYAAQNGIFPTQEENLAFSDLDEVADWARDSIAAAVSLKILQGSGGQLNPTGPARRSELAQILLNYSTLTSEVAPFSSVIVQVNEGGVLTLAVHKAAFLEAGYAVGDLVTLSVNGKRLTAPIGTGLRDVDPGSPLVFLPEKDNAPVLVLLRSGNLATYFNATARQRLCFTMKEQGGYQQEYDIRNLDQRRTNRREDYNSDQIFANFRPIVAGDIGPGVLYRSSSPLDPALGRNRFADELTGAAGIQTVLNLQDRQEDLEGYAGYANSCYSATNVLALELGTDLFTEENLSKLKSGLEFLLQGQGPFLLHCKDGQERTGFVSALLEALMGASLEEIEKDAMLTYENYYHLGRDDPLYEAIAQRTVFATLREITGLSQEASLESVDLREAAKYYLIHRVGLSEEQVEALKLCLAGGPMS